MPGERDAPQYIYSYVLESRGELLWASVHVRAAYYHSKRGDLVQALKVSVHALDDPEGETPRWARKEGGGRSLADRVLFLGWPNSFAMDASRMNGDFGGDGGCAFFVCEQVEGSPHEHSLVDDEAELVEWLPKGWNDEVCTWLLRRPSIAPIQARSGHPSYAIKDSRDIDGVSGFWDFKVIGIEKIADLIENRGLECHGQFNPWNFFNEFSSNARNP